MAGPNPPANNLPAAAANAGACFPGKGVNNPAQPCAPKAPPPPPQVAPLITAAQPIVVVKKKHTNPARFPVLLKTDKAFTGKGTFTAAPADTISFFTVKKGGTAIKFDGTHNVFSGAALTSGVTLFAEGAKASGAFNDVVLTLSLSGGAQTIVKNPVQAKMTAIDVSLQICKPRTAAAGDPPTLSETDKITPGRALHVQNAASSHLRPMLIVGAVKPAGFTGKLTLSTDFLGKGSAVLFLNEKMTRGELPSNSMDIPVAGKKVFAEGIGVSGKLRDIRVKLSVPGLEDDADHVFLTVIEAKLDICESRERVDKPPAVLSDVGKMSLGRSIAFHTANPKSRAMMILHQIKPAAFAGKLVLTQLATGAGRVQVFENETGGAAIASLSSAGTPFEIAHDGKFPAAGLHRFVEGSVVSGAMHDISFKLGVKDVEDDCDRVTISVVDVATLQASLDSTQDASTKTRPAAGTFSTANAALAFAAPVADLMVVILNCGKITVKAQNIRPAPAKLDLRWEIEQDPTDTVAKGLPALDKNTGDQIVITPNAPGTFRLICYCGSKAKHFQNEEIRVLRMVIVKITPRPGGSVTGDTTAAVFAPAANGVGTNNPPPPMSLKVDFLVEGGGHNRRFGLDNALTQIVIGNVGNVTADSVVANYPGVPAPGDVRPGTSSEDPDFQLSPAPGFPNPMVDTFRVAHGATPTGASTPFRSNSNQVLLGNGPGGNGQLVRLTSFDAPAFGWPGNHPTTGNPWTTVQGANAFTEWVVAYTNTFQRNYVVFGTGGYTVTITGTNSGGGNWSSNGATNVVTPWSTAGFPKTGDAAGVQVLGGSFVHEFGMINKP